MGPVEKIGLTVRAEGKTEPIYRVVVTILFHQGMILFLCFIRQELFCLTRPRYFKQVNPDAQPGGLSEKIIPRGNSSIFLILRLTFSVAMTPMFRKSISGFIFPGPVFECGTGLPNNPVTLLIRMITYKGILESHTLNFENPSPW